MHERKNKVNLQKEKVFLSGLRIGSEKFSRKLQKLNFIIFFSSGKYKFETEIALENVKFKTIYSEVHTIYKFKN